MKWFVMEVGEVRDVWEQDYRVKVVNGKQLR